LDVLYLSRNRREFTAFTFAKLVENTNWDLVDRLIVYDDSSTDGALEEIKSRIGDVPVPHEVRGHDFGSPVAVMNDYIRSTNADRFVKIDNDLVVPPAWLDHMVGVMDSDKHLILLGMESPFMGPPHLDWDGTYTWTAWKHIGGVGLMRTDFFHETGPMDVTATTASPGTSGSTLLVAAGSLPISWCACSTVLPSSPGCRCRRSMRIETGSDAGRQCRSSTPATGTGSPKKRRRHEDRREHDREG
jgi:hypothetical protein